MTARNFRMCRAVCFFPVLFFCSCLFWLSSGADSHAAVVCQFKNPNTYTVAISLSNFGLSSTASASSQTGITAVQLNPLDVLLSNASVNVPVTIGGIVTSSGQLSRTIETSYSDYIWRLRMNASDRNNYNTANEHETYAFASSGNAGGTLAHTTAPTTATVSVTIVPGAQQWNQNGSTHYLIRMLNLQIDVSNVRYSGTYQSTFTTTVYY
ncbi:MAG: hypothetical protein HGA77_06250 [Chlorobiaceae bacterium]|nr:hypothetical protein [Chlorobiaceae bacterium]